MNARRRRVLHHLAAGFIGAAVLGACSPAIEWREFRWEEGGFAALLPARPSKETRSVQLGEVALKLTLFRTEPGGAAVAVGFAELPSELSATARLALLARARDAFFANVGVRDGVSEAVVLEGFPGLSFRGEGPATNTRLVVSGRVYATDRRFYQLLMIAPPDHLVQADAGLFLGSLRFLK
jgi:hypothetical protein